MRVYLKGLSGELEGKQIMIGSAPLTIGRSAQNNLQLGAGNISREHAQIRWSHGVYRIRDRNSKHGTYLNGQRIEEAYLQDGDVITIGDNAFRFVVKPDPRMQPQPNADGWQDSAAQSLPQSKGSSLGLVLVLAVVCAGLAWFTYSAFFANRVSGPAWQDSDETSQQRESEKAPVDPLETEIVPGESGDEGDGNDSVDMMQADYLFIDDFEDGIDTAWSAERGEWRMVNGRLQAMSGHPAVIVVGDSDWSDLIIEAKIGGLRNTVSTALQFLDTDPNIVWIGIRRRANTAYYFGIAHSAQSCTYEINDEVITEFYFEDNYIQEEDEHFVRIVADGDLMSMTIDGRTICTFSDASLSQGYVSISAYPGTGENPSYPWVDQIIISEK